MRSANLGRSDRTAPWKSLATKLIAGFIHYQVETWGEGFSVVRVQVRSRTTWPDQVQVYIITEWGLARCPLLAHCFLPQSSDGGVQNKIKEKNMLKRLRIQSKFMPIAAPSYWTSWTIMGSKVLFSDSVQRPKQMFSTNKNYFILYFFF